MHWDATVASPKPKAGHVMRIQLPERLKGEALFECLSSMGTVLSQKEPIELDFSLLRFITPIGLVGIVANVLRWHREHRSVAFYGLESCPITGYLQRMDFLSTCGIELPESFIRHHAEGRFSKQ